jgi:hypothetical protein
MLVVRWGLALALSAIFFLIGGAIIEFLFLGVGKVALLSGASSDEPPSYFITVVRRATGFLFGSALAVYAVIRLVKDLNKDLYRNVFIWLIFSIQAIIIILSIAAIGFNVALILVIVPILECFFAFVGANVGFFMALAKEES